MKLTWEKIYDIAAELEDKHGEEISDVYSILFTDLHKMVTELEDFSDDPERSSEGILEAIQKAWAEEKE